MESLQLLIVTVFGLCFGSFGSVLADRVVRSESIVRPRSRCPGCLNAIARRDQFPVLSYVLLGGRCRTCGLRISAIYPAIELATASLFCLVWLRYGSSPTAFAFAGLAVITPPLTVIDIKHHRLPNALTAAGAIWATACAGVLSISSGSLQPLLTSLTCGAACAGGMLLLALVSKGGMGMGDIKLAGVIGLVLGLVAWTTAVAAIVWAFVLGSAVALLLIVMGKAQRGTAVPFGPMLIAGPWVVLATGINPLTSFLILR